MSEAARTPFASRRDDMAAAWARACRQHVALALADVVLRGSGQVVFMGNPLSGLLIFLALGWAAMQGGGSGPMAAGAVLGCVLSTLLARTLGAAHTELRAGLQGFNGLLVGVAVPHFLGSSPKVWGVLLLAVACSVVLTLACARILRNWVLPGLTFPFVLTTWWVVLVAQQFAIVPAPSALEPAATALATGLAWQDLPNAVLLGLAQIFFIANPVSGVLVLLAIAMASRRCAWLAVMGSVLGTVLAWGMGAPAMALGQGLWGYSAALTAMAVGGVFLPRERGSVWLSIVGVLLTVLLQAAFDPVLQPFGLAVLTWPFVLATWLCVLVQAEKVRS